MTIIYNAVHEAFHSISLAYLAHLCFCMNIAIKIIWRQLCVIAKGIGETKEMVKWVILLAAKPDYLNSILMNYLGE